MDTHFLETSSSSSPISQVMTGTSLGPLRPDTSKPRPSTLPQGKLASLLNQDAGTLPIRRPQLVEEKSRPTSAPPAQALNSLQGPAGSPLKSLFLNNPDYAAMYYQRNKLDPRLPPPLYSPGQSWQLWASPNPWGQSERRASQEKGPGNHAPSRSNLVQMIQEDFPRTPSPLYGPFQSSTTNVSRLSYTDEYAFDDADDSDSDHIRATLRNLSLDCSSDYLFEKSTEPFLSSTSSPSPVSAPKQSQGRPGRLSSSKEESFSAEPDRSDLLEEFRNNKTRKFDVQDIEGHIVEFSSDQYGSRFIQQRLENSGAEEKQLIFNEVIEASVLLMTDVFGNYVIQKFFELGSTFQKTELSRRMRGHVVSLSLQMYGCRVVQKALENLPMEFQDKMIRELDGHVPRCVKDQNGNHVIQKCIERVPPPLIQFIVDAFRSQVYPLSTHPYGCRVLQRIFEHCSEAQISPLLDELHRHIPSLVQDQYGNYVIQHVLERGAQKEKTLIIGKIKGQLLNLSRHKFASNVIEKCIVYGRPSDRRALVEEVIAMRSDGIIPLHSMMKDPFANYVVQRMLDLADAPSKDLLVKCIKPHLSSLRKYPYGKHIIAKVEKILYPDGGHFPVLSSSLLTGEGEL